MTPVTDLSPLLHRSASLQGHLCPWQVLAVRMGLYGADLLGLSVPRADRRLVALVELDGCFADGILAATGCSVGQRTLRLIDHGKLAATFVDAETGRAMRVTPQPLADLHAIERGPTGHRADPSVFEDAPTLVDTSGFYGGEAYSAVATRCETLGRDWRDEQIVAYRELPDQVLLQAQPVMLAAPLTSVVGSLRAHTICARCGDEVRAEREVVVLGQRLCRGCAGDRYFTPLGPLAARGAVTPNSPSSRLVSPETARLTRDSQERAKGPTFLMAG